MRVVIAIALSCCATTAVAQPDSSSRPRARDIGIAPGVLPTGELNAITDVVGVLIGQVTIWEGDDVRTGVTTILPHGGNLFQEKVPAAIYLGNAYGKLVGYTQVRELGFIESPIVLTGTLAVWNAANGVLTYLMGLPGNENVNSFNPIVGETNDGVLNDIRGRHVKEEHVLESIRIASGGSVQEGVVGAGTGTSAFGWKGGIGTSSRKLPDRLGGYTVGVLIQSNYGGVLQMDGLPLGKELGKYYLKSAVEDEGDEGNSPDGSIMMVVATDAPVRTDGLYRIAKRAMLGLGRTGASSSNGSGDYVIAFSTAPELRSKHVSDDLTEGAAVMRQEDLSPLFQATIEATEEAIYNSLLKAVDVVGKNGNRRDALPIDRVLEIKKKYNRE
ncbi:MAG: P1 family peptidase [Acidobacteriota bacterium]|nr:MAG: P1 family peptidase [Acidobacteriota bacterium]